jgi:hypothetical protein
MKTKIFWENIYSVFVRCLLPALLTGLGTMLGITMVLGDNKAYPLQDAINLSGLLVAFICFETMMFTGFLTTLIKVIIEAIRFKHPIRNQDRDDYTSTKSVAIYNALPKEGQESIEAFELNLYNTYMAVHPPKPKKKFYLNFGAKRNDQ